MLRALARVAAATCSKGRPTTPSPSALAAAATSSTLTRSLSLSSLRPATKPPLPALRARLFSTHALRAVPGLTSARFAAQRPHVAVGRGALSWTAQRGLKMEGPSALSKYTRDLTELAKNGKLDPVVGRAEEIRRTIQVLARRTKYDADDDDIRPPLSCF